MSFSSILTICTRGRLALRPRKPLFHSLKEGREPPHEDKPGPCSHFQDHTSTMTPFNGWTNQWPLSPPLYLPSASTHYFLKFCYFLPVPATWHLPAPVQPSPLHILLLKCLMQAFHRMLNHVIHLQSISVTSNSINQLFQTSVKQCSLCYQFHFIPLFGPDKHVKIYTCCQE